MTGWQAHHIAPHATSGHLVAKAATICASICQLTMPQDALGDAKTRPLCALV